LLDPDLKVTQDIICDAMENTKEVLVAIQMTPRNFSVLERRGVAQERRMEEAYKLLSAGLDRVGS
jgi:hypothetical protein